MRWSTPRIETRPDDNPGGSLIRDRLANERTFLAWVRTAANVMIIGLGVARFGDGGEVTGAVPGRRRDPGGRRCSRHLLRVKAISSERGARAWRLTVGMQTRGPIVASVVLVVAVAVAVVVLVAGHDIG